MPDRIISTDWATVLAIPPGTNVAVLRGADDSRHGRVHEVTEQALTLWEPKGMRVVPRDDVQRVAIRTSIGTTRAPRVVAGAITGAIVTGAVAWFASAIEENPRPGGGKWAVVLLGTGLGAAIGSARAPVERFRDRLVYIRP